MTVRWLLLGTRLVLIVLAILIAAMPIFVLLDLARGGTGYGLCPNGIEQCRNPYTAAPELSVFLTVGLFAIVFGIRLLNRVIRRLPPVSPPTSERG